MLARHRREAGLPAGDRRGRGAAHSGRFSHAAHAASRASRSSSRAPRRCEVTSARSIIAHAGDVNSANRMSLPMFPPGKARRAGREP